MRIAAISDIHGNWGALEAVLADIEQRGADITINLGDILSGPLDPRETADRLMRLELPTIRGNHERQLLAPDAEDMAASDRFAADAITPAQRDWARALPPDLWLTPDIFLCHATPHSDIACFLEDIRDGEFVSTSHADIESRAAGCDAQVIFCGHSHIPRVAHLAADRLIINPGSVGIQAYRGNHPVPHVLQLGSPHARYAVAERSTHGWTVDLIAVPYDWRFAATLAERNGRPDWMRPLLTGFL